jgi:hypothetical protein
MKKPIPISHAFFVLFFWVITCFNGMAQTQEKRIKDIAKDQKERSFQEWRKQQPKARIKSVKSAIKQSKFTRKTEKKSAGLRRKENKLRQRIR